VRALPPLTLLGLILIGRRDPGRQRINRAAILKGIGQIQDRAFKTRTEITHHHKTSTNQFGRPLEIQQPQRFSQLMMRLYRKRKLDRRAPTTDFDI
jgi:hypothetical protein